MKYGTTATLADKNVLRRASLRLHCEGHVFQSDGPNYSAAVPASNKFKQSEGPSVFSLETAALVVLLPFQTRSQVVPMQTETWQGCIEDRCRALPSGCDQALLVASSFTLDGRILPPEYPVKALTDATIRLHLPGLPGGGRSVFELLQERGAELQRGQAIELGSDVAASTATASAREPCFAQALMPSVK